MAKKIAVFIASLLGLKDMEKPLNTNNGFGAITALAALSTEDPIINCIARSIGFDCGSKKAIRFGNSAIFPATALLSLSESRIIGFIKRLGNVLIIRPSAILFTTVPIFTNKDVLSV